MRFGHLRTAISILAVVALASCQPARTTQQPADTPSLAPTPTASEPTETAVQHLEPTPPPPEDNLVDVDDLPLGQPGHYVNLAFGLWLQYPETWYTGFGNRPLVASFSDLDPGTHNRHSMRSAGCLIEVNVISNVLGLAPDQLASQLVRGLRGSSPVDLSGAPAVRVVRTSEESGGIEGELVLAEQEGRLFSLTVEYAKGAGEGCLGAWRQMIETWQWLDPDFVVYRNPAYGYAISYPRGWQTFDSRAEGISVGSGDPSQGSEASRARDGIVVRTAVLANEDSLPLKEWLTAQDWDADLADEVPVNGLRGVRIRREGPSEGIQETSAYFQGTLGRVYAVTCFYPLERASEFEPVANAVLFSFTF